MAREYDFGDGVKIRLTARTEEHREMFAALQALGPMGARVARYINDLKQQVNNREETIANWKGEAIAASKEQAEVHQAEFPRSVSRPFSPKPRKAFVFSDSHTPSPWRMLRSGMIKSGNDWICAVTARNRIYNGPLIEAAPDMLSMLERMLGSASPQEARAIIVDANALVERAKSPAWVPADTVASDMRATQ